MTSLSGVISAKDIFVLNGDYFKKSRLVREVDRIIGLLYYYIEKYIVY